MKRISGVITEELHLELEAIAKKDNRSLNYIITIFLQHGVKERTRKRNAIRSLKIENKNTEQVPAKSE
jgi:hypothetical protein